MVEAVLRGESGARRDVVLLNAGAALLVAGAVERLEDGMERAALDDRCGPRDGAAGAAARRAARRPSAARAAEGAPA